MFKPLTNEEIERIVGPGTILKGPDLSELVVESFRNAARSAMAKEEERQLTDPERFAICYMAGVPIEVEMSGGQRQTNEERRSIVKFRTKVDCGLYKANGKWHVVTRAE